MPEQLIDIGANLTHDSFDADRDAVIERATQAGVCRMIITGSSVEGSRDAVELARTHPGTLFATAGVHPHHAKLFNSKTIDELAVFCDATPTVAVGECGLDYFRNFSSPAQQRSAFAAQLELAATTGLPVFLHQRDAHQDFLAILREHIDALSRGVAHCFTGTPAEMQDYLDLGLWVGITGWICDERRGDALRDAARSLPLDRLMLETDAPYLMPRNLNPTPKTRRNEPCNLPHILTTLADCLQADAADVAAASTRNATHFFALPDSAIR